VRTPRHGRIRLRAAPCGPATSVPHVWSDLAHESTTATLYSCCLTFSKRGNSPPSKAVEELTAESRAHPQSVSEVGLRWAGRGSARPPGWVGWSRRPRARLCGQGGLGGAHLWSSGHRAWDERTLNFTGRGRILSSSCATFPMTTPASGAEKDHGISRSDLPCPTGTVTGEQAWRLGALEP